MNKEKIVPFDVWRMVFGDAPPAYFIEVFFRGLFLYLFMLFIMRWLGKRMAGELTVTEMVLMVTLGASVAVAIQVPEGGVLLGFVVLSCAFIFERGISILTTKSKRFEQLSQGKADILVKDGLLQLDKMENTRITRQQVYAALRSEEIYNLGKVERLYLEAGGSFSVFKVLDGTPAGLSLYPPDDKEVLLHVKKDDKKIACKNCGLTIDKNKQESCSNCRSDAWTAAIL